jgi:predicted metal-binding membrane protein
MQMAAMAPAEPWSPSGLLLTFLMWAVMMVGMMLPSAAPMLLLYGAVARKNAERGVVLASVWVFAAGYLLVWTGLSLLATIPQAALRSPNRPGPARNKNPLGASILSDVLFWPTA